MAETVTQTHNTDIQKPSSEVAYSPEMKAERDDFIHELDGIRARAGALAAADLLPKSVAISHPGEAKTQIILGVLGRDLSTAFLQRQRLLEAGGKANIVVLEYDDLERIAQDPDAVNGSPMITMTRWFKDGKAEVIQSVSLLNNGYIRRETGKEEVQYVHRPDASELTRQYAAPTEPVRVTLEPQTERPAELADLQFDHQQLAEAVSAHGLAA